MSFLMATGLFAIPLALLTLLLLGLIVRAALRRGGGDSILFWGFAAAVLGFLGQCSGLYHALTAIAGATEIDPRIVSRGFAESFTSTLWGGALLLVSALAWWILRRREVRS